MTYRFLSPALDEFREAAEYYESKSAGLGADFVNEVDAAIRRVLLFPDAWGRLSESFQHCNLLRYPYTIVYTLDDEKEILIVSVFHQHRKPLSWSRNI